MEILGRVMNFSFDLCTFCFLMLRHVRFIERHFDLSVDAPEMEDLGSLSVSDLLIFFPSSLWLICDPSYAHIILYLNRDEPPADAKCPH